MMFYESKWDEKIKMMDRYFEIMNDNSWKAEIEKREIDEKLGWDRMHKEIEYHEWVSRRRKARGLD